MAEQWKLERAYDEMGGKLVCVRGTGYGTHLYRYGGGTYQLLNGGKDTGFFGEYICTKQEYLDYCKEREALSENKRPIPDSHLLLESLQTISKAARMDITVEQGRFYLYDLDTDTGKSFDSADDVREVLKAKMVYINVAGGDWE
jgi:hypothetical protein